MEILRVRGAEDNSMDYFDAIKVKDVKQFIKDLKKACWDESGKGDLVLSDAHMIINKLAGEKLVN